MEIQLVHEKGHVCKLEKAKNKNSAASLPQLVGLPSKQSFDQCIVEDPTEWEERDLIL